jgi:thymus-specific serine protease
VQVLSLDTSVLPLLTSQQALADAAQFIAYIKQNISASANASVVTWGGSYAGALSAWARLKHGDVVTASVASSGPVQANLDFSMYMQVVGSSLAAPVGGGSSQCASTFQQAFQAAQRGISSPSSEAATLKTLLSCQSSLNGSEHNIWAFWENLSNNIAEVVQYNLEEPGELNITNICAFFDGIPHDDAHLIEALGKISAAMIGPGECMDNDFYSSQIAIIANSSAVPQQQGVGMRQWTWQTCNEFGYYQTCSNASDTTCIFDVDLGLEPFLEICADVFAVYPLDVADNVNASLHYYGGNSTAASNVFFVDGTIDPWHALAVQRQINPASPAVVIDGTAHCRDLHQPLPDDPAPLQQARQLIGNFVAQFSH